MVLNLARETRHDPHPSVGTMAKNRPEHWVACSLKNYINEQVWVLNGGLGYNKGLLFSFFLCFKR